MYSIDFRFGYHTSVNGTSQIHMPTGVPMCLRGCCCYFVEGHVCLRMERRVNEYNELRMNNENFSKLIPFSLSQLSIAREAIDRSTELWCGTKLACLIPIGVYGPHEKRLQMLIDFS